MFFSSPLLIVILFAAALAWGAWAWRAPRSAVLWFPLILPLYLLRTRLGPLPTTGLELCFLGLLVGSTARDGLNMWKVGYERLRPWRVALGLWIIATLIAVVIAPDHWAALGLWRAYILEPMVFFILLSAYLQDERDRMMVIRSLILTTCFIALWSVVQFATGRGIPHPWDTDSLLTRRATGPFPFPNAVALFCAPIAALCIGLLNAESRSPSKFQLPYSKFFLIGGFVSATLATLLAKSIGGSLGIAAATFIALLWNRKTRYVVLGMCTVLALTIWFVPPLHTKVVKTLTFNEWSGKVRTIIWKEAWNMIKDRPLTGAGFGAYPEVIQPYRKARFIETFQYPHNILLNLWSETGALGIIAFGWICVTWARQAKKEKMGDGRWEMGSKFHLLYSIFSIPSSALPLIAILVHGLVDVPYFKNDLAFEFWILAALASVPLQHEGDALKII